ncbi:MAG TPA: hypothetical protein VGP62_18880 [Bryobacteraceae bacterium]|jgi:hypothetical protein|nr:hypothetical protein [Bryobacteraceae bacterium]
MAAITSGESGVTFGSKRATVKDLSHRNGESRAQRQSERQRATYGSLAPANGSVLYEMLQNPVVTIGGIPAVVSLSGIAPESAGQYQINVAIPSGVAAGDSLPLTVKCRMGVRIR